MIARERLPSDRLHGDSHESLFHTVVSPKRGSSVIHRASHTQRRHVLSIVAIIGALLMLTMLLFGERVRKLSLDGVTALRYRAYSKLRNGRVERGPACPYVTGKAVRRAIVTYMRTDEYLPLLDHLYCSVQKSNPDLEFAVMVTKSISSKTVRKLEEERGLSLIYVDDLQYSNSYEKRFRYNWLKVRAWELPYHEVLLVDSDTVILEDISVLFSLPARFAAVADQVNKMQEYKYPRVARILQGGVLFLRPCPAVARHMQLLIEEDPLLQFSTSNAEQEFFSWYFRHEAIMLPERYNTLLSRLDAHDVTSPAVVHYTSSKPFEAYRSKQGPNRFLCSRQDIESAYKL